MRNKQTVQTINQATTLLSPRPSGLTAYAGDDVTLYWDETTEFSVDRITGEDFEGYKIYKQPIPSLRMQE